jgi:DNA-directed RNA polymerase specialized sigma24 family protein
MDESDHSDLSASGSITGLYRDWRGGKADALGELIARFRPRLLALAHSTLSGRLPRVSDAEDALQSAMISFWERVEEGDLEHGLDRDDLWNILGQMTARKAMKLLEKEGAQKRGGGKVITGLLIENSPDSSSEVGLDVVCAELIEMLDPDLRSFALLRLMGHKNQEIATEFDCSERKVERKLNLVRAVWAEEVEKWQA